jgi:hypothetical protein
MYCSCSTNILRIKHGTWKYLVMIQMNTFN